MLFRCSQAKPTTQHDENFKCNKYAPPQLSFIISVIACLKHATETSCVVLAKSLEHVTSTATMTRLMKLLHGTMIAMAPTLSQLWPKEASTTLACMALPEGQPEAQCLLQGLQCTKSAR